MGVFLKLTFEARYIGNDDENDKKSKVVKYIAYNLTDMAWQESISDQLRNQEEHHITLYIVLRFFDIKDIEEGKLKSFAQYKKKVDKLVIDQILILNNYADFPEDEMRKKVCGDVFNYLKEILKKYKNHFLDFDAIAFISLLKERIEKIKEYEL